MNLLLCADILKRFPIQFPIPSLIAKESGRECIVVGCSSWAMLEMMKAVSIYPDADLIGINDSPLLMGFKPRHWISLHADKLPHW